MNVRIDYQPGNAGQGGGRPRRSSGPDGSRSPRRKRKRSDVVLLGAVGFGIVALVAAFAVAGGDDSQNAEKQTSRKDSSQAPTGPADGITGLLRGQASGSGVLGSKLIAGVPRGFPDSQAGAVESATVVMAQSYGVQRMTQKDRADFLAASFVKPPTDADQSAATYQAQNNLNAQGQLIEPATGEIDTDQRYMSLCHPTLGAYKVEHYTSTSAAVDVWLPCISGVVSDQSSDLSTNWMLARLDLAWTGGDWKITKLGSGSFNSVPTPADASNSAPSFAERARILASDGPGWTLYKDASEQKPAEVTEAKK